MGKSKGSTTTTTGPDAQSQEYAKQLWAAAQGAAQEGGVAVNPLTTQAAQGLGGFAQAGNLGLGTLSGDPAAVAKLMNPYQSQVMDQMNQQYERDQQSTMTSVNDAATRAGAFGGSRHGVAEGVALGQLGQGHAQQMAGLLSGGYQDAMGRAGTMANLGFSANGALASLGDYMHGIDVQNNPANRQYQFMNGAMQSMPHGMTQTQSQTGGHNGVTGALGGAAALSGLGPWGAAAGGLLGLFS